MISSMPAEYQTGTLHLPDGRDLSYCRYGPAGGHRVLFLYGTPGTMYLAPDRIPPVIDAGVSLVVPDRPGNGASTRQPGRTVADFAADAGELARHLGWDRFAVWGGSGGAPHALACAALLRDQITRCAAVVSPAPFDAPGLDWFGGMTALNVEEFTRAAEGESAYRPLAAQLARDAVAAARRGGQAVAGDYGLAESDRAALAAQAADPGHLFRTRAAYTGGVDGCVDDMLAFTRPWGFDPAAIEVPVTVWYGPDDVLCPRPHADWLLARIPGAQPRELPGGHVLGAESLRDLYAWLTGEGR
jgi:pimeloyl-ACP methyl ester carboxylesterase